MTKAQERDKQEAIERLREWVKPGDTLTTLVRHVSSSGMYRAIDVYKLEIVKGEVHRFWLSYNVAKALGWRYDEKRAAVGVSGTGMDMGFHLVYSLAWTLFGDKPWRCTGERCPSADHSNGRAYPHKFPTEYGSYAVDPDGPCPVWDWDENERRGGRCGKSKAQHPTRKLMHKGGGYALRQEWM